MNWPTFLASVTSAIVVAVLAGFLNPRFQHHFWKKQKLREQRVLIAERFAALHAKVTFPSTAEAGRGDDLSSFFEEDALLVLVQVLFDRADTRTSGNGLKTWVNNHPMQLQPGNLPVSEFLEVWKLRVDLLSRLFAEAFEVSTDELEKRARSKG